MDTQAPGQNAIRTPTHERRPSSEPLDLTPAPLRRGRVFAWVRRATVAGAVLTLVVHVVLGLVAGWWTVGFDNSGSGSQDGQLIELDFPVMTEAELAAAMDSSLESESPQVPEPTESTLSELSLFDAAASAAVDELATEQVDIDLDTGAGDLAGDGSELGETSGGGSLGGASFFGLAASGTRFAYIVDVSSSMRDDNKMEITRAELVRSIDALAENSEYLIVLYSNEAAPLGGRRAYKDATTAGKRRTREQIAEIYPSGGTHPLPAFELLYAMRSKPDAIYFMTDGRFDAVVPGEVASLNRRHRIPVHTILFGEPSTSTVIREQVRDLMKQIARQSGGNFVHHGVTGGGP
ncbi:MAG: vWA domain-containing protein [Planctomycetota bacterium]